MLSGALLLIVGLIGIGIVAVMVGQGRKHATAQLDRRIAVRADTVVVRTQARRSLTMPERIAPLFAQAQIEPTPHLICLSIGLLAIGFAFSFALLGVLFALLAVAGLATAMWLYVRARARKRIATLIDSLPLYLDGVRQMMAVGSSLAQALMRSLPAAAPIVQDYLGPAARRIELGAPIGESFQQLADRLAIPEIAMLTAAIRVNLRFGGPMTTILSNLAQIMRERLRITRELASATAEAKVSTQLLVVMPILLIALLLLSNPMYRSFFMNDPRGHRLAMIAAVLQGTGIVVMIRLKRLSF